MLRPYKWSIYLSTIHVSERLSNRHQYVTDVTDGQRQIERQTDTRADRNTGLDKFTNIDLQKIGCGLSFESN